MNSFLDEKAQSILRRLEIGTLEVDCFGLIETWYSELFGFKPDDRIAGESTSFDFQNGYNRSRDWLDLQKPINHCVVVMSRKTINYGHCGLFYNKSVIHMIGNRMRVNKISDPIVKSRINNYKIHKNIMAQLQKLEAA